MDKSEVIILENNTPPQKLKKKITIKAPVSVLALIQLVLATDQLLESLVITLLNTESFYHQAARWGVQIMAIITGIWVFLTLLLLIGLFSSKPYLILIQFIYTLCLCPLKMTVLMIMCHSPSTSWYPIFRTLFTLAILLISLLYEWRCFKEMKENLNQL